MKIDDLNIDKIILKAIEPNIKDVNSVVSLDESFVAKPKQYTQVSELVSQKTKDAHMTLYKGYIEAVNKTSAELDTADRGTANSMHSTFRSLKLDETRNLNAVWLHELYFSNCFDPNSDIYMDSLAYLRLQRDFGTFDDWQDDFVACALSAGEGWAVCGYHVFLRRYINTVVQNHSDSVMLGLIPLIVVDMWSHSYYRDYTNDKKSFVLSQMKEFNWNVIEERFKRAETVGEAMK